MSVGLYDDPLFRKHDAGPGHPERPERLEACRRGLQEAGLEPRLTVLAPRPATHAELERVHSATHVSAVAATEGRRVRFDGDTRAGPHSYAAARMAAGGAVDAVDRLLDSELDSAFCLSRPPGHHAEPGRAMGFCLFNNVAVAAAHALARGLRRILVVDFDVHHGNGTQAAFESDARVLYVSSHAYPFYPGTGALDEVGEGEGRGTTFNLPMPQGFGDAEYGAAYRDLVEPVVTSFDPELVLVSAGFDAYAGDPLAGMRLSAEGYTELSRVCLVAAAGSARGRILFVLEGGYSLEGLARGSVAVVEALLRGPREAEARDDVPALKTWLATCRQAHARYWKVL